MYDPFAEALLRVGPDAYLHGQTVLALLGLAGVSPRPIRVAVPRRARPKLPLFVELVYVKDEVPTTQYHGLGAQQVADALLECLGSAETERLFLAARQARKMGLLPTPDWRRLQRGLQT